MPRTTGHGRQPKAARCAACPLHDFKEAMRDGKCRQCQRQEKTMDEGEAMFYDDEAPKLTAAAVATAVGQARAVRPDTIMVPVDQIDFMDTTVRQAVAWCEWKYGAVRWIGGTTAQIAAAEPLASARCRIIAGAGGVEVRTWETNATICDTY